MKFYREIIVVFALIVPNACVITNGDELLPQKVNEELHQNEIRRNTAHSEEFPDVTFTCNYPALCNIERQEIPAQKLESKTDKPDSARPYHLSFRFRGQYEEASRNSSFEPKIDVYSIVDFRQILSVSPDAVNGYDDRLNSLRKVLLDQPSKTNAELPFVPYVDATQAFNNHIRYISFKNGKGLFYLTQMNIEPSLINNEGLTYVFQGITDNNKYFIHATFPVKTKILPDGFDVMEFEDYKLPVYFNKPHEVMQNEVNYRKYVEKVNARLAILNSDQFNPELSFFEKLLASFDVN